ncbi:MAG: CDP-alcohol phosphatidyltransferase family protein, partial [Christensenellales bacterium]
MKNLPNILSAIRIILVPFFVLFYMATFIPCGKLIALIIFIIASLTDMLDGKIARKYNIKAAVKLQYRDIDTFIHPDFKDRTDVPHIPRFMSTKLTYDQFCQLVNAVKAEGMLTMSTPFDETGVEWCKDQGLDIIKVASCSALDWPLLMKIAAAHKPIIL